MTTASRCVYLDNNATTAVDSRVLAAMMPFLTEQFGNPSSMHAYGAAVAPMIRAARESVAALIGAERESEIIFTSGGTESNNTAILSALRAFPDRREVITSAVEHPAILRVLEHLSKSEGIKVHIIPVDNQGRLDLEAYRAALSPNVALVTLMWANNETGTIFPIPELAEMAKEFDIAFHTDAVQATGKIAINLTEATGVDMLSLSSHKLHGPKGVGALYVRRGHRFRPLLRGGHQERDRRAGTENTPGIAGLGKAAEIALAEMADATARMKTLRDKLEKGLLAAIPSCFVTGDPLERLPNTANIAFEYIEGEGVLLLLNRDGVAASSGSACTSGSLEPSHVLRAMNIPYTAAHGATRFSLSRDTTEEDVDHVLKVMPAIVEKLRSMSPYWGKSGAPRGDFQPAYA